MRILISVKFHTRNLLPISSRKGSGVYSRDMYVSVPFTVCETGYPGKIVQEQQKKLPAKQAIMAT